MATLKLNLLVGLSSYGGNGGLSSESPCVRDWLLRHVLEWHKDERLGEIYWEDIADCPITMTRNRFVRIAREKKCDLLLMIDSDQFPDYELIVNHDPEAKPFWSTSFDFLHNHYHKGPVVIGAPYCGPSPYQNVYVFQWQNFRNADPNQSLKLGPYSREEAFRMKGIQPVAALPTGLILFDVRCFDLVEPPYFYYEYEDEYEDKKCSTEDVTATRDIGMAGQEKLNYNPVLCNWDAWAGHVKQETVGKPRPILHEQVNEKYRRAVLANIKAGERMVYVNADREQSFEVDGRSDEPAEAEIESVGSIVLCDVGALKSLVRKTAMRFGGEQIKVVELGSWIGRSALAMESELNRETMLGQVYCVDHWFGTPTDSTGEVAQKSGPEAVYKRFCENVGDKLGKTIIALKGQTGAYGRQWERELSTIGPAHLVFVDADHSYEAVKDDIEAWLPCLHPEGILCGHDYVAYAGVKQAVDEAFGDKVHAEGDIWWVDMRDMKVQLPTPQAPVETNGHAKKKKKRLARAR